ncbi:MAG: cytoChrome c biosis protein transrane region [Frankiales bacterium]|nr:cytoChrome c biosis protein transrane region [Frankiales bacterium]
MNPRASAVLAALVTVVAVVAVVVTLSVNRGTVLATRPGSSTVLAADKADEAPELQGVRDFDNTPPLTLKGLRGKVVLVDFWTYTCINCRRTFPFLRKLSAAYDSSGLVVLGVHSPEFGFEKDHGNVARAVKELGVTWPVAEDPQMATWDAFSNQYWPADYLIDRAGKIRYFHYGEGGDREVEDAVRTLLDEGGTAPAARIGDVASTESPGDQASDLTPETYFGAQRGAPYAGTGGVVAPGKTVVRKDGPQDRDKLQLGGSVTGDLEYLQLNAGGSVSQRFHAKDVYVTSSPVGGPVVLDVTLDGKPVPVDRRGRSLTVVAGRTVATLANQDLLHLITGPAVEDGLLKVTAETTGARFFTLTYGA